MRIRVDSQWRDIHVEVTNHNGSSWNQADTKKFCRAVLTLAFNPTFQLYYRNEKGQITKLN